MRLALPVVIPTLRSVYSGGGILMPIKSTFASLALHTAHSSTNDKHYGSDLDVGWSYIGLELLSSCRGNCYVLDFGNTFFLSHNFSIPYVFYCAGAIVDIKQVTLMLGIFLYCLHGHFFILV